MDKRVLVIIPAYNEEENIVRVVDNLINNYGQLDYVVINDGSRDNTAKLCREHGYNLVDLPVNLGLAGAFQAGMKYALVNDYDYAIQFDGDGQHNPQFIEGMEQMAEKENLDIVIGSRFASEKKPFTARMLGSRLIEFCILVTCHKRIKDPTSGMRMFNRRMIHKLATSVTVTPDLEAWDRQDDAVPVDVSRLLHGWPHKGCGIRRRWRRGTSSIPSRAG